jgi:maltose/moltooligosaccharide transporter
MQKPPLTFWQIWNMSFGFFGLQFGWALQSANMSAIYEYLGATPDRIPLLWLAGSVTGLVVQPIVGHLSDHTWGPLGRRRPYLLVGAVLSTVALVLMPNSSTLWMAAGLLWVLDASINTAMHPLRAMVAEQLPDEQHTRGFTMQSLFIGLGAMIASALPWVLSNWFHLGAQAEPGHAIPVTVRYSFYLGAAAFFGAVLWTAITTRETPPEDLTTFQQANAERGGLLRGFREILRVLAGMPPTMRRLALVQVFTWLGLFFLFLYFPVAVARDIFGAPDETSPLYRAGIEWAGLCFAMSSVVTCAASFGFIALAHRFRRKTIHTACLLCGAAGLLSVGMIHDKWSLLASMAAFGIAWAGILSMPYAMLAGVLPAGRTGIYMGVFNLFIVLPQIAASLGFGWVMNHLLGNDRTAAVVVGGLFMFVAAVLTQLVPEQPPPPPRRWQRVIEDEGMLPTATPTERPE